MSSMRITIQSPWFPLDAGDQDEKLKEAMATLLEMLKGRAMQYLAFPISVEIKLERVDWSARVVASVKAPLLPPQGREFGVGD